MPPAPMCPRPTIPVVGEKVVDRGVKEGGVSAVVVVAVETFEVGMLFWVQEEAREGPEGYTGGE